MARRRRRLSTWRGRALAGGVLAGLCVVVVVLIVALGPGVERAKRSEAGAVARSEAANAAALAAVARRDQVLHVAGVDVAGGRGALYAEMVAAVAADARARVRAGRLAGPVLSVSCSPYPPGRVAAAGRFGAYECLAVTRLIRGAGGAVVGQLGDPFWVRVDFARGRLAWCKITPRPGEQAVGHGVGEVALAPACDLSQPPPAGF